MGRSEAISSHLKPSIISATIYRATYRAFVRLGDDDRINFRPRSFREISRVRARARMCLHPCKCRPQQRLKDCTEVFVARPPSFQYRLHHSYARAPRHQSTQTVETNMLFSGADPVRSRLSCRINFRRNNGRGQKLSGRSFIEQDATGRARYLCNERVCIVNKNNNLMRKTASHIFSPSSLYGLRRAMLRNASMRNGMR